jgi:hypothetical protein
MNYKSRVYAEDVFVFVLQFEIVGLAWSKKSALALLNERYSTSQVDRIELL